MMPKLSLKNRIVIGFTLQTLLVTVIAFATIGQYVDYIEETVLYEQLTQYLDAYVAELNQNQEPVVPADITIFSQDYRYLPSFARDLGPGGHEIVLDDGSAYHVLNKQYNGQLFVLIKDQTEFESTEYNINFLTILVLVLFSIVSFVFARSLAEKIIEPVVNLSEKVSTLNVDNFNNVKLDYPDDEIGVLIKVIYDHIYNLNYYLQREKWFTGDISHELRTPMMIISSSLDLLKQNSTTHEQREQIYQRIEGAVSNVNELVNTFLLLARGKLDGQEEPELCDLADLSCKVIEDLEPYIQNKNINLRVSAEKRVLLPINAALFSIVVTNLVKNAIFNTEVGEICVVIQPEGFQVKDTGTGLPVIIKQFINDSDVLTTDRNNNHLGLGLSIVKRVCEREKWEITAVDRDEGGACFMIKF